MPLRCARSLVRGLPARACTSHRSHQVRFAPVFAAQAMPVLSTGACTMCFVRMGAGCRTDMAEVCTEPRSDQGKGRAKRKGRCNEKPGISLSRPGPVFTGMEMRSRGEASGPLPQPGVKANGGGCLRRPRRDDFRASRAGRPLILFFCIHVYIEDSWVSDLLFGPTLSLFPYLLRTCMQVLSPELWVLPTSFRDHNSCTKHKTQSVGRRVWAPVDSRFRRLLPSSKRRRRLGALLVFNKPHPGILCPRAPLLPS